MGDEHNSGQSIPAMMAKLDELYAKEEKLMQQINVLMAQYDQLQEDKELLQNLIMYQSNKNLRTRQQDNTRGMSILDRIRGMK